MILCNILGFTYHFHLVPLWPPLDVWYRVYQFPELLALVLPVVTVPIYVPTVSLNPIFSDQLM